MDLKASRFLFTTFAARRARINARPTKETISKPLNARTSIALLAVRFERFSSDLLVFRNNLFVDHLPRLIVKRKRKLYILAVGTSHSRHPNQIPRFPTYHFQSVDHKAVVQGYGRICLNAITFGKNDANAGYLHCRSISSIILVLTEFPHPSSIVSVAGHRTSQ